MEPISEKTDKKSVFSVYYENKTTMSYDRDNPFKKAVFKFTVADFFNENHE